MNELLDIYMENGISLFEKGINTVILPLELTAQVLPLFKELNIIILGGDIHKKNIQNNYEFTYDNWSYQGDSSMESIKEVEIYLETLMYDKENYYISFVFK